MNAYELKGLVEKGRLVRLPSKRRKKIEALVWLSEHIPSGRRYTEAEFSALLDELHSFGDPAALRRELYDHYLISRSPDGREYWLDPDRPSLAELLKKYCGVILEEAPEEEIALYSGEDLKAATEFRERIHEEALERVQRIMPGARSVYDPYPVEAYFQQHWDYPGQWYTAAAVPESAGGREGLIDRIVRETVRKG
ncbi:MAG: DUF2087 domain-containing protein [Firmicutes bacterium]|nr:DUF2087 domain-containing protein [Bacillota bacterium]